LDIALIEVIGDVGEVISLALHVDHVLLEVDKGLVVGLDEVLVSFLELVASPVNN